MTLPLILTLMLDEPGFDRLDALRRTHFPPERNLIPAHVTLFHHLPGGEEAAVLAHLRQACAKAAPFPLRVAHPRSLGRGVALAVEGEALSTLRARLATAFAPWLVPQDRQGFRPHVTVQNKVTPDAARALLVEMQATFVPFAIEARGLLLWRYLGGPWDQAAALPFAGVGR